MEKLYVIKNFRAWGELPEDDYDRTSYQTEASAIISKDVSIDKLAAFVNDEKELNILIHFLNLDNLEEIMGWLGNNSLSTKDMLIILNLDKVDATDIAEIVYNREFSEYALEKYKSSKEIWTVSFRSAVDEVLKDCGLTANAVRFLTDGEFCNVDEQFFAAVHEAATREKNDNNRYYRNPSDEAYYGIIRLADECMSTETKRHLVGDKFDTFIHWAALSASNEVVDKFIYKNKGTFDEKRHFYEVTLRNFVMDGNMFLV